MSAGPRAARRTDSGARSRTTYQWSRKNTDLVWGCVWVERHRQDTRLPGCGMEDDPAFRKVDSGPYLFKAQGHRVIENFWTRTCPSLIAGIFAIPVHPVVGDYAVETSRTGCPGPAISESGSRIRMDRAIRGSSIDLPGVCWRPLNAYFRKLIKPTRNSPSSMRRNASGRGARVRTDDHGAS